MEPKYKIDDIVTIKKKREGDSSDYRFTFSDYMVNNYGGKSLRIISIGVDFRGPKRIPDDGYKYKLEGNDWHWASSMFEDSSETLLSESSIDNSLDAFIAKKKRPKLDFTL